MPWRRPTAISMVPGLCVTLNGASAKRSREKWMVARARSTAAATSAVAASGGSRPFRASSRSRVIQRSRFGCSRPMAELRRSTSALILSARSSCSGGGAGAGGAGGTTRNRAGSPATRSSGTSSIVKPAMMIPHGAGAPSLGRGAVAPHPPIGSGAARLTPPGARPKTRHPTRAARAADVPFCP